MRLNGKKVFFTVFEVIFKIILIVNDVFIYLSANEISI
jgi:hypothetical protein